MRLFSTSSLRALCLVLCAASIFSLSHADSVNRWLPVLLVISAYLSFCLLVWQTYRQGQQQFSSGQLHVSQIDGQVLVAYASQTGYAEQLARKTVEHLQQAGVSTQLCSLAQLDLALLQRASRLLLIASTTGEGDAPDQAAGFQRKIMSVQLSLPQLQYGILALGDRHYQHYCAFGHRLDHWLRHQQARSLFDLVEVDNGDEGALRHWQHHLGIMSGHTELSDWTTPGYQPWQLRERHLLNPGSLGGAVYHLVLSQHDDQRNGQRDDQRDEHGAWQAGDIAEIGPEYPPTENNAQAQGERPVLPHREYSISSISSDGQLELLVRQMRYPDGTLGIGSGWLTEYASTGQNIALRIRENRQFHTPLHDCPLILIGNGTGLAGLRAHLKQRIRLGYRRNCLFFGERQQECDFFHQADIAHWQQQGFLPELHLCFSRDQPERRYVQHALQEQSSLLRQWVAEDAVIMVCGSLHGMADEVHACLQHLLGEEQLEHMAESGHYRRDVY